MFDVAAHKRFTAGNGNSGFMRIDVLFDGIDDLDKIDERHIGYEFTAPEWVKNRISKKKGVEVLDTTESEMTLPIDKLSQQNYSLQQRPTGPVTTALPTKYSPIICRVDEAVCCLVPHGTVRAAFPHTALHSAFGVLHSCSKWA
jgi:hypothetical protein